MALLQLWCLLYCGLLKLTSSAQPHILFIVIDDLGYTDLGYHNAEFNTTNLDSLALSGIDLTSYYVGPVCTPTRSAIMTGFVYLLFVINIHKNILYI